MLSLETSLSSRQSRGSLFRLVLVSVFDGTVWLISVVKQLSLSLIPDCAHPHQPDLKQCESVNDFP